jgi:hypothetical protein
MLTGSNLFLADSVATTPDFAAPVDVPAEFTGTELLVPHPAASGVLYLKLRDDPATVQTLTLPVTLVSPPTPQTAAAKGETAQPAAALPPAPPTSPSPQEPTPAAASPSQPPASPDGSPGPGPDTAPAKPDQPKAQP